jgi:hypothetical protein
MAVNDFLHWQNFLFLNGWFPVSDSKKCMVKIKRWDRSPGWEFCFEVPRAVEFQCQVLSASAQRKLESGYCPRLSRYWLNYQPSQN